jgi:branched-chain amino acid transport system permease protein
MKNKTQSIWKNAINSGVIAGLLCLMVILVGMVESFSESYIIYGLITLGDFILLAPIFILTYSILRNASNLSKQSLVGICVIIGMVSGFIIVLLILLGQSVDMRPMFVNASPKLFSILMRNIPSPVGLVMPPLVCTVASLLTLGLFLIPMSFRNATIQGILWLVIFGTLRDQILIIDILKVQPIATILKRVVFAISGLRPLGAIIVFVVAGGLAYYSTVRKTKITNNQQSKPGKRRRIFQIAILAIVLLALPYALGIFFSEILDTTGYFIIMGLGLNIVVGFSGLLDLGYVAFYAIGAYTVGVLTSPGLGLFHFTFWQAMPYYLLG